MKASQSVLARSFGSRSIGASSSALQKRQVLISSEDVCPRVLFPLSEIAYGIPTMIQRIKTKER
jgi:hypothetical protein